MPVRSSRRSAKVDLPWSMWAIMQKFLIKEGSILIPILSYVIFCLKAWVSINNPKNLDVEVLESGGDKHQHDTLMLDDYSVSLEFSISMLIRCFPYKWIATYAIPK